MILAKLNTAIVTEIGPVLAADGTMSSGALAYTDFKIFKNGTDGALNASATATHKYEGVYALSLTTSDISALGECTVVLNKNPLSAAPVKILVVTADAWDSLCGATVLGQAGAQAAIVANNLDHLAKTAVANNADMTAEVTDGTVLSNVIAGGDTSTFVLATHALTVIGAGIAAAVARIGAWTGTGVNTLLGALRAMFRKDVGAAMPSDITDGGTATVDHTTDSLEGIRDNTAWNTATGFATAAKLLQYVQLLARKDSYVAADLVAILAEINADTGSGVGAFANTTDALESLRDNLATATLLATVAGYLDTEIAELLVIAKCNTYIYDSGGVRYLKRVAAGGVVGDAAVTPIKKLRDSAGAEITSDDTVIYQETDAT